jgi:hypothetical protein
LTAQTPIAQFNVIGTVPQGATLNLVFGTSAELGKCQFIAPPQRKIVSLPVYRYQKRLVLIQRIPDIGGTVNRRMSFSQERYQLALQTLVPVFLVE